jgi:DNA-binding transcriptional LysR family regulator
MHIMDWDAIRTFLAVARTGRLAAAARRLGVEHTTVARRIAALEDALGVRLFHRTTSGLMPTPHAERIVASAERMEAAALGIGARAREHAGRVAGVVRLALVPEMASHWLAHHLGAFRARHPELELRVLVGTRPPDVSHGEAELAVRSPRPRQEGLVAARIARGGFALYAVPALARRARRIDDVTSARRVPLLVYTAEYAMLQAAPWFQAVLREVPAVLTTNSTHLLLAAARAGAGATVLPHFVARREPGLVAVSHDVATTEMWMITHPEFRRDPRVRATADFLREVAAGPDGLDDASGGALSRPRARRGPAAP